MPRRKVNDLGVANELTEHEGGGTLSFENNAEDAWTWRGIRRLASCFFCEPNR